MPIEEVSCPHCEVAVEVHVPKAGKPRIVTRCSECGIKIAAETDSDGTVSVYKKKGKIRSAVETVALVGAAALVISSLK